jgi:hypothetical protein
MSLRVACPECDTAYTLAGDLCGKKVVCKQCQHIFRVQARLESSLEDSLDADNPTRVEKT